MCRRVCAGRRFVLPLLRFGPLNESALVGDTTHLAVPLRELRIPLRLRRALGLRGDRRAELLRQRGILRRVGLGSLHLPGLVPHAAHRAEAGRLIAVLLRLCVSLRRCGWLGRARRHRQPDEQRTQSDNRQTDDRFVLGSHDTHPF